MIQNWNRADLKQRAKTAFRKNYWAAVIVSLVLMIVTAGGGSGGRQGAATTAQDTYQTYTDGGYYHSEIENKVNEIFNSFGRADRLAMWGISMIILAIVIVVSVIVLLFSIFVGNVLDVGGKKFYIENMYSNPGAGRLGYGFACGYYWNVVKVMFLRQLFIFLWSLLFVIPGIIKAYEYYMVPYLLAEYPDMSWKEASSRSREMMSGNKWNTFILEISFLPWEFLSVITWGIAGILYVNPYVDATKTELYDVLAGSSKQQEDYYNNQYYDYQYYNK